MRLCLIMLMVVLLVGYSPLHAVAASQYCFPAYGIAGVAGFGLVPLLIALEALLLVNLFNMHPSRTVYAMICWALLTWPLMTAIAPGHCTIEKVITYLLNYDLNAAFWSGMASALARLAMLIIIKAAFLAAWGALRKTPDHVANGTRPRLFIPVIVTSITSYIIVTLWLIIANA